MFFKEFSKYVLAGIAVMPCACSLVYANKDANTLKNEINGEIDEIIEKMPQEAKTVSLAREDVKKLDNCQGKENYFYFFKTIKKCISNLQNKDILEIISSVLEYLQCVKDGKAGYFGLYLNFKENAGTDRGHRLLYCATNSGFCEFLKQAAKLEGFLKDKDVSKVEFLDAFRYYGDSLHFYLQALYRNIIDYEKAEKLLREARKNLIES